MKKGYLYIILICLACFSSLNSKAQNNSNDTIRADIRVNSRDTIRVEAFITPEGDTIPQSWLPTV